MCMGLGGLIGSVMAAILTSDFEPRFCFYICSTMSLLVFIAASRMNDSLETDGLKGGVENDRGILDNHKRYLE